MKKIKTTNPKKNTSIFHQRFNSPTFMLYMSYLHVVFALDKMKLWRLCKILGHFPLNPNW